MVEQVLVAVGEIFAQSRHADKVVEKFLKAQKKWGARDRRFFAESVYDIVRWWRYFGAMAGVESLQPKDLTNQILWKIWAAWCWQNYQQLPDWPEIQAFQLHKDISSPAVRESYPDWLYDYALAEIGEDWHSIAKALNQPAEVFLRTNTLKTTRDQLQQKLQGEGVDTRPVESIPTALHLTERKNVALTNSFKGGFFEVQDAASQLIAPLLNPEPGMFVVDACAGAGGKSLHLAALMKNRGKVLAMDIHEWKLEELKERARRNGASIVGTRLIDENKTAINSSKDQVDALLLDVPCSGMGVLRRNADTKWKLTKEELENLQKLQAEILHSYSGMVKAGGRMVYATCSVLPAENQKQVQKFLENNRNWSLQQEISLRPDREGFDGFYAALITRQS